MLESPEKKQREAARVATHAGLRALRRAVELGDAAEVRRLIAAGAAPDVPLAGSETALMRAATLGYEDVAAVLLEGGATVDAKREDDFTPLLLATFRGHKEVVRLLLASGADTAVRTRLGSQPQKWAAEHGFEAIAEMLANAQLVQPKSPEAGFSSTQRPVEQERRASTITDTIKVVSASQPYESTLSEPASPSQTKRPERATSRYRIALPLALGLKDVASFALYSIKWRGGPPANRQPATPPVNGASSVPATAARPIKPPPRLQASPTSSPQDAPPPRTTTPLEVPRLNTASPGYATGNTERSLPAVVSDGGTQAPASGASRAGSTDPAAGGAKSPQAETARPSSTPTPVRPQAQGAEIRTSAPPPSSSNVVILPSPTPSPKKKVIQWP
jgi:hypothetical protein